MKGVFLMIKVTTKVESKVKDRLLVNVITP